MDYTIENIITYSNLLTVTKSIIESVGFEFQSPLDDGTIEEIVSSQVMACVESLAKGNN